MACSGGQGGGGGGCWSGEEGWGWSGVNGVRFHPSGESVAAADDGGVSGV